MTSGDRNGDDRVVASFDGIPLHYAVHGAGDDALVLVHGWSCSAAFWREQTALCAGYRVVTLDLAGHGRSRAAAGARAWSIEAFARDVETVVADCGARRVVLAGHSMGGAVALEASLLLGERCVMLLGVDTFTDAAFYAGRPAAEIAERLAAFAGDFRGMVTTMIERITGPHCDQRLRRAIAAAMAATDPGVALPVLAALLAWDIGARWPLVRARAVTINSAHLARGCRPIDLAGLSVHELEGPGHFLMLEDPAAFNALVQRCVASIGFMTPS